MHEETVCLSTLRRRGPLVAASVFATVQACEESILEYVWVVLDIIFVHSLYIYVLHTESLELRVHVSVRFGNKADCSALMDPDIVEPARSWLYLLDKARRRVTVSVGICLEMCHRFSECSLLFKVGNLRFMMIPLTRVRTSRMIIVKSHILRFVPFQSCSSRNSFKIPTH